MSGEMHPAAQLAADFSSFSDDVRYWLERIAESGVTVTQRNVSENADSITIGSPTNGQVKVYGDAGKPEELEERVLAAIQIMDNCKRAINGGSQ